MSSPPMRQARRSTQTPEVPSTRLRRPSTSGQQSAIPMAGSRLAASRIANTQPTYDFLSGNAAPTPTQRQPLGQSLRQSTVVKADIGNEDLRAQIKTLQYKVDSLEQERELATLRHDKELRDAQLKAEEIFRKAQADENSRHVPSHKYDALRRELKDSQDQAINQQNVLEKRLRTAQEECRAAKDEAEEVQTESESIVRQNQYQLKEVETKCATLQQTLSDLRDDLAAKSSALQTTQGRLAERESERGELESEVLRLKAQTGDTDTLAVIKRELSEQVSHIRKLESTNREQSVELKHFRRVHKAVEVVEEEKNALKTRLHAMEDLGNQLREAQLQRQILEDEKTTWTSYLQNEGRTGQIEFESPHDMAKALVTQRLENANLLHKIGTVQPELVEKDEIIRCLEEERSKIHSELEKLRASGGAGADSRARTRLERQRALAVKEVEYLREQLRTFDSEEQTYHSSNQFDSQKSQRIADLENLVDSHRQELQTLHTEFEKLEKSTPASASSQISLKRPREEEEDDPKSHHLGQLSRKNRALQDALSTLQSAHALLQTEYTALKTQLTSLQQSAKTRILYLRSNPTSSYEAIKASTLTTLRRENADLLAQLSSSSPANQNTKLVPWSVLESKEHEMQALNTTIAEKEKRNLRLKQIYANKALELREAIFSLLGWKIEFRPPQKYALSLNSGTTNPQGGTEDDRAADADGGAEEEVEQCLIFDGEKGEMKVAGGMESAFGREVRPLIAEWVGGQGRGNGIPGLMASILLRRIEKERG